jgi:serine protease
MRRSSISIRSRRSDRGGHREPACTEIPATRLPAPAPGTIPFVSNPTRVFLVLAAIAVSLAVRPTQAQQASAAYSFLMTPAQIRAFAEAWNNGGGYMPGETIVKFRQGMAPADETRALSVLRRNTAGASTRWIGDRTLLLDTPADADAEAIAATLRGQPEVEWAQPNYIRKATERPTDPDYSRQWNFDLLDLPRAWDINNGSAATVTVAVIDFGITTVNQTFTFPLWTGTRFENVAIPFRMSPDLSAARIKSGRDFIFWNGPVIDMEGHGTHVASTVLEDTNNTIGTAGIAYQANLLPLKGCIGYWELQLLVSSLGEPGFVDPDESGFCLDSSLVQAMRFAADSGAQVINMSLGSSTPTPALRDAITYAVSRGSVVTLPAGNSFTEGNAPDYPAAYAAEINGAIAVGAVGPSSKRAYYSNTGSYVELAAPGGDDRDGGDSGFVYQVGLRFSDFDPGLVIRPRFDNYALIGAEGTSMSAPHVAGVAALLYSQGITTPAAIEAALERFATDLGPGGRDNEYGFGLVNPRAALRGMGLAK